MDKEQPKEMSFDDIQQAVLVEIANAEDNRTFQKEKRTEYWDRFYGRNLGNERKGRSQFITRDVMDVIEWMMPYFIKTFASGDPKIEIEIKGQPPFVGKALMDKIQVDLSKGTPTIFTLFYQWFKDALVSSTSHTKVGWVLDQLMDDPDVEIVET